MGGSLHSAVLFKACLKLSIKTRYQGQEQTGPGKQERPWLTQPVATMPAATWPILGHWLLSLPRQSHSREASWLRVSRAAQGRHRDLPVGLLSSVSWAWGQGGTCKPRSHEADLTILPPTCCERACRRSEWRKSERQWLSREKYRPGRSLRVPLWWVGSVNTKD